MDAAEGRLSGARRRLGLIVPSPNTVAESDMWRFTSDLVTVHTSRMYLEETTADDERRMVETYLPSATRDLATVRPDVVVFSCTSAGAVIGEEAERNLVDEVGAACRAQVVSTNAAVKKALGSRAMGRVAVVTPYIDDLTRRIVAGLEGIGVVVAHAVGMGIVDPFAIAEVQPQAVEEFARQHVDVRGIDGLFVSCTNLRAYEARKNLEAWAGVPVVTSNQAALEAALEMIGLESTEGDLTNATQ